MLFSIKLKLCYDQISVKFAYISKTEDFCALPQELMVKIVEINEETVILDANHPLAGEKLIFDLEVVGIS